MPPPDHRPEETDALLSAAARASNMAERSRLIDEAVRRHMRALAEDEGEEPPESWVSGADWSGDQRYSA
jgi:hypothetical protein